MENNKTREEHIAAWKHSGLNKKEYALAQGLKYGTFKGWVYGRDRESEKVEWKPVQIKEEPEEAKSFFELRIGGKWKFEINLRIRL